MRRYPALQIAADDRVDSDYLAKASSTKHDSQKIVDKLRDDGGRLCCFGCLGLAEGMPQLESCFTAIHKDQLEHRRCVSQPQPPDNFRTPDLIALEIALSETKKLTQRR